MKSTITLFIILCSFSVLAQNISQWRGTNRDGVYQEKKLQKSWPANGPELLWFNENIGNGYGSPAISSNMLFVNGETDSISQLFAYDLKGKLLWKSPNGKEYVGNGFSASFPGARSTPTIVGDLIYVCSGNGRIACIEKLTGKEKWSVDMMKDLGGILPKFGYSESLVTDDKNVYCFPGNTMTALNRLTGKKVWTSKFLNDTACFTSPIIIKLPSRSVLVTLSANNLLGIDTQNGELLWTHKQENVKMQQQCNSSIYDNGFIYYVTGDGNGAVKLELSADGGSIKEVWRNNLVKNNFNGFVKLNDYIFCADAKQKIKCLDVKTGNVVDSLKITKGSIIAADNMLYCYSDNGTVSLIQLNGTKMEITGQLKCDKGTKEHFSHPVIDNGNLYFRHGKALMAYKISEK